MPSSASWIAESGYPDDQPWHGPPWNEPASPAYLTGEATVGEYLVSLFGFVKYSTGFCFSVGFQQIEDRGDDVAGNSAGDVWQPRSRTVPRLVRYRSGSKAVTPDDNQAWLQQGLSVLPEPPVILRVSGTLDELVRNNHRVRRVMARSVYWVWHPTIGEALALDIGVESTTSVLTTIISSRLLAQGTSPRLLDCLVQPHDPFEPGVDL